MTETKTVHKGIKNGVWFDPACGQKPQLTFQRRDERWAKVTCKRCLKLKKKPTGGDEREKT